MDLLTKFKITQELHMLDRFDRRLNFSLLLNLHETKFRLLISQDTANTNTHSRI